MFAGTQCLFFTGGVINTQPGDVDYIPIFKHNPQPQGPLELQSVNWEAGINVLDDQYV